MNVRGGRVPGQPGEHDVSSQSLSRCVEVEIDNACPQRRGRGNLVRAAQIKVKVYQRRMCQRSRDKQCRGQHQGR